MKILLLCEPRSGSTKLANWFFRQGFDTRFETIDPNSKWALGKGLQEIKVANNKHLVLKETFYPHLYNNSNLISYIDYCDKIIFVYRENTEQQGISYDHAVNFRTWDSHYTVDEKYTPKVENIEYLNLLKSEFKNFISNYKKGTLIISYEDLYIRGKIDIIKEYLDLKEILTHKFPYGYKLGSTIKKSDSKKII